MYTVYTFCANVHELWNFHQYTQRERASERVSEKEKKEKQLPKLKMLNTIKGAASNQKRTEN